MDFKYTNQRSKEDIQKREKARIDGINRTKAIHQAYKHSSHSSLSKPRTDRSNPLHYLSGPARQLPFVSANANGTVEIIAPPNQHPPQDSSSNEQQLQLQLPFVSANANGTAGIIAPPNQHPPQHSSTNEQQLQLLNNPSTQPSMLKLSLKQKQLSIINKILSK